jgi:hypothetical protein
MPGAAIKSLLRQASGKARLSSIASNVDQVTAAAFQTNESRGQDLNVRLVQRWAGAVRRPQGVYRRRLC